MGLYSMQGTAMELLIHMQKVLSNRMQFFLNLENAVWPLTVPSESPCRQSAEMASAVENRKAFAGWSDVDEEEAYMYAMQLVSFSALPMTLKVALELGLLQRISAAGPGTKLSPDELVAHLGTSNPHATAMIERILRLLASYSILSFSNSYDAEGRAVPHYGAMPVCKYLTADKDGVSMESLALMNQDKVLMENWYHFKDAVINGGVPFDMAYGMNLFDYSGKDPRFNSLFNDGMKGHSSIIMKKILDAYQGFRNAEVVVDVGGGLGSTISMITGRHPHVKGINFDLPHVVSHAPPIPGVEHIGGDMFVGIPSGDIIFMKWILHDWSDECCVKVLKNCRKNLPHNGKVVIMEYILPKSPENTPEAQVVFHADMIMLAHNPGGKERTEKEFKTLALQSGFSGFKSLYVYGKACIMEFGK